MIRPSVVPDHKKLTKLATDIELSIKKLTKALDDVTKVLPRLITQLERNNKALRELERGLESRDSLPPEYHVNVFNPNAEDEA